MEKKVLDTCKQGDLDLLKDFDLTPELHLKCIHETLESEEYNILKYLLKYNSGLNMYKVQEHDDLGVYDSYSVFDMILEAAREEDDNRQLNSIVKLMQANIRYNCEDLKVLEYSEL